MGGRVGVAVGGDVVATSVGLALSGRNADGGCQGRNVGFCGTGATVVGGGDDTTHRDTEGTGDTVGRGTALF